ASAGGLAVRSTAYRRSMRGGQAKDCRDSRNRMGKIRTRARLCHWTVTESCDVYYPAMRLQHPCRRTTLLAIAARRLASESSELNDASPRETRRAPLRPAGAARACTADPAGSELHTLRPRHRPILE